MSCLAQHGSIFVSVDNISVPEEYNYPPLVAKNNTKDWKVYFFLVQEVGIASIPGSCFHGEDNKALGTRPMFACRSDQGLQLAVMRLQQLERYIVSSRWISQQYTFSSSLPPIGINLLWL